ncbi:chaplin [Streptomyces sp. NPDC058220]|uniref:chaplin n=1 Tax=unclassified Streptomyces TaxID=2593676 RepID=UPI003666F5FC
MRQVTRKGLITVAAAGGVLALGGGYAQADAGAEGIAANSPGVLSGNSVQAPVHVPVNVCGNTVNVVGLLNPALGNTCANTSDTTSGAASDGYGGGSHATTPGSGAQADGSYQGGSHTAPSGGAHAEGGTSNSPGIGSGNSIQVPIDLPVNACGNSVTIGGLLNPTTGSDCENDSAVAPPATPEQPDNPITRPTPNTPETQIVAQPAGHDVLAQTGAGSLGMAIPAAAGLLLAGSILYRRARAAA